MRLLTPRQIIAREPMFFTVMGIGLVIMCAELGLGTPLYFAGGFFTIFLVVILTLRKIGFATIAGIQVFTQFFCQIGYSQVAKVLAGAASDTNLQAPELAILVTLLGTVSCCAAAIAVNAVIKKHRVLTLNPSIERLAHVRDISFVLGMFFLVYVWAFGASDSGERDYGGLVGFSNQYSFIVYLAVVAETWLVLRVTDGRESVSRTLLVMLTILEVRGFMQNAKVTMATPVLIYFVAAISYRGFVTRTQIFVLLISSCVFIAVIYPVVQASRAFTGATGLSVEAASEILTKMIEKPDALLQQFEEERNDVENFTEFTMGLGYLGRIDDFETRFTMISTTDMISHAVDTQGTYGPTLITEGFEDAMPTFLYPDKPRIDTGDELVWHYNLRPCCDSPAYPTIGYFADSFAALGWSGVIIIPFICDFIFFSLTQIGGTQLKGNFIGIYLVMRDLFVFADGGNIAWYVMETLRNIPLDILAIFAIFYFASMRGRGRAGWSARA